MRIEKLEQRSADRVAVLLENGETVKSSLGVMASLRLYVGKELDEDGLAVLRRDSARTLARDRALELLSRRPMSRRELCRKLLEKGETADSAEYSCQWLEENGFLDDARYAAMLARHYGQKGYGEGRLRAELLRRGIARELWEDAIAELPEADEKLERLIASKLSDPKDPKQLQKLSASLVRRGYSWEQIRSALRRVSERDDFFDE